MSSDRPVPRLAWFAGLLTACTYCLVVFGSAVRAHGAGLSCPDWPLCFGKVIPPINFEVALEFGHRVLAGSLSIGFIFLAIGVYRRHRSVFPLTVLTAVVLAIQVILGGLTVLELLAEWTVTSHLLAGNAFAALLLLHAFLLRPPSPRPGDPAGILQGGAAALVLILLPLQLALGGLVSSSGAGLACPSWPDCAAGVWFPTWTGLVGLQLLHRVVGYSLFAAILAAAVVLRTHASGRAALVLAGLTSVQIIIGVSNVFTHISVEITLLHSAGAAAMVLTTTWMAAQLFTPPAQPPSALPTPSGAR